MQALKASGSPHPASVFISQTCRTRSASELDKGDTPNRHKQRKIYLRWVIDELISTLQAAGLTAWVDTRQINAGDRFERALCLSLIRCSAAIVLVDRDALNSQYMREEARLLGWRRVLEPDLRVIPVLLGGVSAAEFTKSSLGRSGGLAGCSALVPKKRKQNRVDAHAAAVEVAGLFKAVSHDPAAARWVDDVAYFIGTVPEHVLVRAAEKLGVDDETLRSHHEKHALISAALLNAQLEDAFQVIRFMAEFVSPAHLQSVKSRIAPLWVDLDDARRVMTVATLPQPSRRIVSIVSGRHLPADHAILRASAAQNFVKHASLGGPAGEEMEAELTARYDDALRNALNFHRDDAAPDIRSYLAMANTIAFALISGDQVPAKVTRKVVRTLIGRFPGVIFVIVVADEEPSTGRRPQPEVIRLAKSDAVDRRTLYLLREIDGLSETTALGPGGHHGR